MAAKLSGTAEFFSKAFGFYNWYLSTLFPFASYFLVFVKQAPQLAYTGANVAIMGADLLYDGTIIDQVYETRKLLAETLCRQYFGVKLTVQAREDEWLLAGIQSYLSALLLRVFHGKNDYRYQLKLDMERSFELEPGMPPLHSTRIPKDSKSREWLSLKSRIILCLLERKLEKTGLQRVFMHLWSEACEGKLQDGIITTKHLVKSVKKMTGKDMRSFADQWIFGSGAPSFSCSFLHNRKRSTIEVDLSQWTPNQPSKKYSGSLLIRVHEQEGTFDHVVHIDDLTHRFELPYHTKIKKARKKRSQSSQTQATPILAEDEDGEKDAEEEGSGGEDTQAAPKEDENEVDLTQENSPILWIRIDPDMDWFCRTEVEQPDFMWMEQLENDRDVAAQHEAALGLGMHPSEAAVECFERALLNWKYFYRVRIDAAYGLAKCAIERLNFLGLTKLFSIFGRRFGLERTGGLHPIPKPNKFDNFSNYFVQKGLPKAFATIFDGNGDVPDQVILFLTDLLKFNDNSFNSSSDNYYLSSIIEALGMALHKRSMTLTYEAFSEALSELDRFARLEKILPYFRNTVFCSVLKAKSGLGTSSVDDFTPYLQPGSYVDVRLASFMAILQTCFGQDNCNSVVADLIGALPSDRHRRFTFKAIEDCLEHSSQLLKSDDIKGSLWNLSATVDDPNYIRMILNLMNTCYECASDDVLIETAQETLSTLPSALPQTSTAPIIRLNLNNHELGSSDDEVLSGPNVEEADWLNELGEQPDSGLKIKARPLPKIKIHPLHETIHHDSTSHNPIMNLLQEIWDNYDSFPFRYPVDPSVPGYYAIIKYPMDLSTMQGKRYSSLESFARDLRLMFDNCFTFNQPGSLIYDQALRLRQFAYKCAKKAFPDQSKMLKKHLKASEPIVILPDEQYESTREVEVVSSDLVLKPKLKLSIPVPVTSPQVAPPAKPAPIVKSSKEKITEILEKLKSHQHAYWFAQPIDPVALGIPTYFDIIKEPMDFSTVTDRLESEQYSENQDNFKRDVDLIFSNAKTFNAPNTMVHQHALIIEKLFHRLWSRAFPTGTSALTFSPKRIKLTTNESDSPGNGLKIKLNLTPILSDWEQSVQSLLEQVRLHENAEPFLEPVDAVALNCPTYYQEIKNPMDFSTMFHKLRSHLYGKPEDVTKDVKLIVSNCEKFNGKEAVISEMARSLLSYYMSLYDEYGL